MDIPKYLHIYIHIYTRLCTYTMMHLYMNRFKWFGKVSGREQNPIFKYIIMFLMQTVWFYWIANLSVQKPLVNAWVSLWGFAIAGTGSSSFLGCKCLYCMGKSESNPQQSILGILSYTVMRLTMFMKRQIDCYKVIEWLRGSSNPAAYSEQSQLVFQFAPVTSHPFTEKKLALLSFPG